MVKIAIITLPEKIMRIRNARILPNDKSFLPEIFEWFLFFYEYETLSNVDLQVAQYQKMYSVFRPIQ